MAVAVFGSDDISFEGLAKELEECKNYDVSNFCVVFLRSYSLVFVVFACVVVIWGTRVR